MFSKPSASRVWGQCSAGVEKRILKVYLFVIVAITWFSNLNLRTKFVVKNELYVLCVLCFGGIDSETLIYCLMCHLPDKPFIPIKLFLINVCLQHRFKVITASHKPPPPHHTWQFLNGLILLYQTEHYRFRVGNLICLAFT